MNLMDFITNGQADLRKLTQDWGSPASVTLYLDRCQVDTPENLVHEVWDQVSQRRTKIGNVVDFGAGDGRFAKTKTPYRKYTGYEVDINRCLNANLPKNASMLPQCAFAEEISRADVCIGNPPYVRNQDLPLGWRQNVAAVLEQRTGLVLSGLANAWQYFFLLSLASVKADGLVALVIPYEWVSRPSARILRDYIKAQKWDVSVYRLRDDTFDRVLTTASITVVDKRESNGKWEFFEEKQNGGYRLLKSESGGKDGVIQYTTKSKVSTQPVYAKRGLSPGTQEVLTLTEGERVRSGLEINLDVVPCITSLRHLPPSCLVVDAKAFKEHFRREGHKCWLIRTDIEPSSRLKKYLASIPSTKYQTATCLKREEWWKFSMPETPALLAATGFRGSSPKIVVNTINAKAVGGVCGIYGVPKSQRFDLTKRLKALDISSNIVPHSNGLKKLEINQLNTLLASSQM